MEPEKKKYEMTEEQKEAGRQNLIKARAARAAKRDAEAGELVRPVMTRKIRANIPVEEEEIVIDDTIAAAPAAKNAPKVTDEEASIIREIEQRAKGFSRVFKASDEQPDPKYVPAQLIPKGWVFEWKTVSVMGQPIEELRPGYLADLEQNCWEPVPAALLRSRLPRSYALKTVDIGGQRLMMRPKYLSDEARDEYEKLAKSRLTEQNKALRSTPDGELERRVHALKRSYEPVEVPDAI